MQDMLAYLIARDTMHQNQWIQMLHDLGDPDEPYDVFPIPDSLPDEVENQEFNYAYLSTNLDREDAPDEPWTAGEAPDMEGDFEFLNQHDVEGAGMSVPGTPPETYNDPNPQDEDGDAAGEESTPTPGDDD